MLDYGKGMFIATLISTGLGVVSTLVSIANTVDNIKNADRRAAITGCECGSAYARVNYALEHPEECDVEEVEKENLPKDLQN